MKRSGGVRQVSPVSHSQSVGTKVLLPPLRWKRTLHSDSINESNSSGISQFSFLPLLWNHECTSWPVAVRLDWIAQKNGCRGFHYFEHVGITVVSRRRRRRCQSRGYYLPWTASHYCRLSAFAKKLCLLSAGFCVVLDNLFHHRRLLKGIFGNKIHRNRPS